MPIRYVAAIILAVGILGLASASIDNVATDNTRQQMERATAEIEETAVTLFENEEVPPPGLDGPRRHMEIILPDRSMTSEPIEYLEIRRVEGNTSVVKYQLQSGAVHQRHIKVPITASEGDSLRLNGTGRRELLFTLARDENGRVVVVQRAETASN